MHVTLLFLGCFHIIVSSKAYDNGKTVSGCEKKHPDDISFDFSHRGLKTIRKPFVSGSSVKCINLEGNLIENFEQAASDDVPELTYLNLARNPLSFENFTQSLKFPKLETLVLDGPFVPDTKYHNPLSEYYKQSQQHGHFENNERGRIYFDGYWRSYNDYRSIHFSAYNLKKLSLRNYGDESVLQWLNVISHNYLTHLYIDGNHCTVMPVSGSLVYLNMDDNDVSHSAEDYPKLQYLSMERNRIENVCNENCNLNALSLRRLPVLQHLSLVGNNVTTIEPDAFANTIGLQVLNLDKNKISHLPRNLFDNSTNLTTLSLAYNNFSEIPHICRLVKLEHLNMSGNKIISINDSSFCILPYLNSIDLSFNGLTTVAVGTFGKLSGLSVLDLSWNNIKVLPDNWMGSDAIILDVLYLESNAFTDPANMSLGKFDKFREVYMAYNPMEIPTRWFQTLSNYITINVESIKNSIV